MAFYTAPEVWDGSERVCMSCTKVKLQVISDPTTPYPILATSLAPNYSPADLVSLSGAPVAGGIITKAGWYYLEGNITLKYEAGAGSTIILSAFS